MKDQLRDLAPLPPSAFFGFSWSVPKGRDFSSRSPFRGSSVLPPLDDLLLEEAFADLALTWSDRALTLLWKVRGPFSENTFPRYRDGDSIELFIDTRPQIQSTAVNKFCHHLLFLPDESGVELTRLRADDERPFAENIKCHITKEGRSHLVRIDLSDKDLFGFEPKKGAKLGFAYRVNRYQNSEQSFPIDKNSLESHPHMWGTLVLEEK